MNSLRCTSIAAVIAGGLLLLTTSTWAARDDTVNYLLYADLDQSEILYYGSLGQYYTAYLYSIDASTDLYYAWLYAPYGSLMEYYSNLAMTYEDSAETYWYYSWLFGSGYLGTAVYYSYLAQIYTAYAQYFATYYM